MPSKICLKTSFAVGWIKQRNGRCSPFSPIRCWLKLRPLSTGHGKGLALKPRKLAEDNFMNARYLGFTGKQNLQLPDSRKSGLVAIAILSAFRPEEISFAKLEFGF